MYCVLAPFARPTAVIKRGLLSDWALYGAITDSVSRPRPTSNKHTSTRPTNRSSDAAVRYRPHVSRVSRNCSNLHRGATWEKAGLMNSQNTAIRQEIQTNRQYCHFIQPTKNIKRNQQIIGDGRLHCEWLTCPTRFSGGLFAHLGLYPAAPPHGEVANVS